MTASVRTIAVCVLFALAGCSGNDSGGPTTSIKRATTTEPAKPTTTTTTAPTPVKVGDEVTTKIGNTIAVLAFESKADPGFTPSEGHYAAADVQYCLKNENSPSTTSMSGYDWYALMPDATRYTGSTAKTPALNEVPMVAGECVRGWVSFNITAGDDPAFIGFDTLGPDDETYSLRWAIG